MSTDTLPPNTAVFMNETLGFTVPMLGPDSPEQFDLESGEKGACLRNAVQKIAYHKFNNPFRKAFAAKLLAKTGVEWPKDPSKPIKVTVKDEAGNETEVDDFDLVSEKKYMRFLSSKSHITAVELNALAQETAKEIGRLDLSPVSSLKDSDLELADTVLGAIAAGELDQAEFINKFESGNGIPFSSLGEFSRTSVAKALAINGRRVANLRALKASQNKSGLEDE